MAYAEILTDPGNWSIVQLPTRKFPGVVVQGDSLSILVTELQAARAALADGDVDLADDELGAVLERLETVKRHYEATLADRGIQLPYAT